MPSSDTPLTPLQQKLCVGDRRTVGLAPEVAAEVVAQPALLAEILDGLREGPPLLRARAARVLHLVADEAISLLVPHKQALLHEVAAVDQWAGRNPTASVFAQVGISRYRPLNVETSPFLEPESFYNKVRAADLLISQAGIGSIITAL